MGPKLIVINGFMTPRNGFVVYKPVTGVVSTPENLEIEPCFFPGGLTMFFL